MVVDQLWSDEDEVTVVGPGENVKIKLKGVEEEDISSGFVLCDPNNTCKTGRIFDAQVWWPIYNINLHFVLHICYFRSSFWNTKASFVQVTQPFVTFTR